MVTQVEIARRVGLDVSSVNKILNQRKGPVFRKETVRKVFKIARDMGYDFGRLKYQHRRRHPRREVSLGAEICIYRHGGEVWDQGMATIRDISLCGARISNLALPKGSLPVDGFSIGLRPMEKPAEGVEIPGRIVRIHAEKVPAFGVEFSALEPALERKLRRFASGG